MPSFATSQTTSPEESDLLKADTPIDPDEEDAGLGFHLCEFCESRGIPNNNPRSVCECTPIKRVVAGSRGVTDKFDVIFRIAETAVIEHWGAWHSDDVTVTRAVVPGQCNDEFSVHLTVDGVLSEDLGEPFELDSGVARLKGFDGDGTVRIGVTLNPDWNAPEPTAENDLYTVDRHGICQNCGTVASVVSHGHEAPDGGKVTRADDLVRCELSYPEEHE